jgi:hypothetical protein
MSDVPERRAGEDRRRRPTPPVSRYTLRGRRRRGRRGGEDRVYVDWPGGWVITAFVVVFALSLLDAYLTLRMVAAGGGEEANPLMRLALSYGEGSFVILKAGLTLTGLALLALHKNWPLGRACLWLAFVGYAVVTALHIWGVLQRG